jgi:hypothetical protein
MHLQHAHELYVLLTGKPFCGYTSRSSAFWINVHHQRRLREAYRGLLGHSIRRRGCTCLHLST